MWWAGWVQCDVCGMRHVSVIDVGDRDVEADPAVLDDQQCPNCRNMTCDPCDTPEPGSVEAHKP